MEPKLDHYIGVFDNVFDDDECKRIINRFEDIQSTSWKNIPPQDGGQQFSEGKLGRKDSSLFFEHLSKDASDYIQQKVGECMQQYMETYVGLDNASLISYVTKVQKTSPRGGYHVWHAEHGACPSSMKRVAVWILYLTTHETDGETEFLQQGIRVAPQAGRVVIWPASFTHPHRGNPVYDKDKYIATGWFEHT